ncbi:30671_t:CDS:2, partial [Racocetra persica]
NDLKTDGRLYKFWNDYYSSMNNYDVSCTEESNINYDGMNRNENEIMYSDCIENEIMYSNYIELKKTITTLESENQEYARANIVLADLLDDMIKEKQYLMNRISTLEKELVFALSRNCNK